MHLKYVHFRIPNLISTRVHAPHKPLHSITLLLAPPSTLYPLSPPKMCVGKYVRRFFEGDMSPAETRRVGFPWSEAGLCPPEVLYYPLYIMPTYRFARCGRGHACREFSRWYCASHEKCVRWASSQGRTCRRWHTSRLL